MSYGPKKAHQRVESTWEYRVQQRLPRFHSEKSKTRITIEADTNKTSLSMPPRAIAGLAAMMGGGGGGDGGEEGARILHFMESIK